MAIIKHWILIISGAIIGSIYGSYVVDKEEVYDDYDNCDVIEHKRTIPYGIMGAAIGLFAGYFKDDSQNNNNNKNIK